MGYSASEWTTKGSVISNSTNESDSTSLISTISSFKSQDDIAAKAKPWVKNLVVNEIGNVVNAVIEPAERDNVKSVLTTILNSQIGILYNKIAADSSIKSFINGYEHAGSSYYKDIKKGILNQIGKLSQTIIFDQLIIAMKNLSDDKIIAAFRDNPPQQYAENSDTDNATGSGDQDPIGENDSTDSIFSSDESDMYTNAEFKVLQADYKQRKTESDLSACKIDSLRHVFGIPYQFLPETDTRYGEYASDYTKTPTRIDSVFDNTSYMGRKYIERIAQRANIVYITPGYPDFMKGVSKEKKKGMLRTMLGLTTGQLNSDLAKAFTEDVGSVRFYSFSQHLEDYYKYLNPMLRAAARYLNLHDRTGPDQDTTLDKYNYAAYIGAKFTEGWNAFGALTFYADGINSTSDSITNSTEESSFVSSIDNGISNTAQEVITLSGKGLNDLNGSTLAQEIFNGDAVNQAMDAIDGFVNKFLGGNAFFKKLALSGAVTYTGGHIIFPEIWRDADFRSDSITINFKFVSPDNDDESIFWNEMVPMCALICLGAPHGYEDDTIDGYLAPFMVRAYCQSMFNIDMGYITGISITKGAEGMWTASGLPTAIEVSVTIKDLYNNIYISTGEKEYDFSWWNVFHNVGELTKKTPFLKNTAMLNWIANACGVNVNKPDVLRDIDMYFTHVYINPIMDLIPNATLRIFDTLRNWSSSLTAILSSLK